MGSRQIYSDAEREAIREKVAEHRETGRSMNDLDAVRTALAHLGEGFSLSSGEKTSDVRCDVQHGETVAVDITPAYVFVRAAFYQPDGTRVRCSGQGATFADAAQSVVDAVIATVGRRICVVADARKPHTFVADHAGRQAGPPEETCTICACDPRNSIHAVQGVPRGKV